MSRACVVVRDALPEDAEALGAIWTDFTSEADRRIRDTPPTEQVQRAVRRLQTDPSERLVVALVDEVPVGVAHLRRAAISPIHDDDAVHVGYLHVLTGFRRRGVGKSLLETAVDWADDKDTKHIVATVAANARESNRFLARLGLTQAAVLRATTASSLRSRLGTPLTVKPVATNVVAARRMMRRSRFRD
jgi:L-amino acid N-acyltransferase YncA